MLRVLKHPPKLPRGLFLQWHFQDSRMGVFASHARRYAHAQRLPFIYAFKPRPLYRALNLSGSEQESALGKGDEKISGFA